MSIFSQLLWMLLFDAVFLGLLILALVPLAKYKRAAFAVLKRNFVSYFSTPTGYVFLCLFVLLTSFAAFWPHEFFNSNMATLDQLNVYLPYIMMVFIPAITMSIWADERRQGTDELLLTIPADDFDIVLGKYLAAALIFTASLLFSQLSTFAVLNALAVGEADLGLFFTTYIGYWLIGLAMLSIGMVASFLTGNLTVGFILGAAFNTPLAFAASADVIIPSQNLAQTVRLWSLPGQFEDFGRGVVSLSSLAYFVLIVVVGIYLSMVLIGRRHWLGGRDGHSMLGHYITRSVALVVAAVGLTTFFTYHDFFRYDATSQRVSSLSKDTRARIREIAATPPVYIEAFISNTLPESYVKTKFDLVSLLREMKAKSGGKILVNIHDDMEPFSEQAKRAEDRYGIKPMTVLTQTHGSFKSEEIFLAAAFTSGLEKVVVPFFSLGTPVEYELTRSICTVAKSKTEGDTAGKPSRRKIGILRTDAQMNGGFNMQNFSQIPPQLIVEELKKQYDVEDVDPNTVVPPGKYDVLLVVQPSSLGPPQMDNLVETIRHGQATAIFEDPAPIQMAGVPGTDAPKRSQGGMMGMRQQPQPKGDLNKLWDLLGIYMVKGKQGSVGQQSISPLTQQRIFQVNWRPFTAIIWEEYNPYPKSREMPPAVIFASPNAPGTTEVFNPEEPAVSGLREVVFLAPGAISQRIHKNAQAERLKFTPLVTLGTRTGLMTMEQLRSPPGTMQSTQILKEALGESDTQPETEPLSADKINRVVADRKLDTGQQYCLAARIQGKLLGQGSSEDQIEEKKDDSEKDQQEGKKEDTESAEKDKDAPEVNVIVVTDIDILESLFLRLRDQPGGPIEYNFQNVTFVLNVLDVLAGDERFLDIRKRRTHRASLKLIENRIQEAEQQTQQLIEEFEKKVTKDRQQDEAQARDLVQHLQQELEDTKSRTKDRTNLVRKVRQLQEKLDFTMRQQQRVSQQQKQQDERRLRSEVRRIQRNLDLQRLKIQNEYKFWAVTLPPIPPLLVALAVFARRRLREREGLSKGRLR